MPGIPSQDAVLFTGAATTHSRDTQTSQGLSSPAGGDTQKHRGGRGHRPGGVTGHGLSPPKPHCTPWTPNCSASPTAEGAQAAPPSNPPRSSPCPPQQFGGVPRVFGCPQPHPQAPGHAKASLACSGGQTPPSPKATAGGTTRGSPCSGGGARSVLRCPGLCRTPPAQPLAAV